MKDHGVIAEIEKSIYEWANASEGIMVKSDRDRFIYLFEQKYLDYYDFTINVDKFGIEKTVDIIQDILLKQENTIALKQ